MKLTAQEIAQLVNGELQADAGIVLTGAAALDDAGPGDVSFLADPKYLQQAAATKAAVVIVARKQEGITRASIRVDNPQLAFARVLAVIDAERIAAMGTGIHPKAVISPGARIGTGASVGPYSVIEDGAVIGEGARIMAHCYVGASSRIGEGSLIYPQVTVRENITIGKRAVIHPGVVIGSDGFGFTPGPQGIVKIPQIGTVEIGDDVEIGANSAIDRATTGATVIGSGTKIDNLVHIAHNVMIGRHCIICAQVGIAGSTKIGDGVTFGGQSGATGHITVGSGATIAARGAVTANVRDKEVISGYPGRPHREALKRDALINRLPELYETIKKLKERSNG
jgi:UDP-3-O-[3-hydroxymyristoyl] glucosamine N-acyltransferase